MATTEELNVVIKTVADTAGAQQVSQALQQTQRAGAGVQQQLTSSQQGANAVMRALLQQHGATLETFEKARQTVSQSTGVTPTLLPKDFGIQAAEAAVRAKVVGEATKTVGESAQFTTNEFARMGLAFVGAGVGLSAFSTAGQLAHEAIGSIIQDTIALDQAQRENTIALGQQAAGFQAWAATVSQQAGISQRSLLQAQTSAQQFGRTVGFDPQQTLQLTALATVLGQIHGTDVAQTMSQLTAALSGSATAAQALNLQLDDGYVAFTQLGGATDEVLAGLDPSTQAWYRYQAALKQTADQVPTLVGPVNDLRKAQGDLDVEWENFAQTTGPGVIGALTGILTGANNAANAIAGLNAATVEHNRLSGLSDEGFKNEGAALDALGQKVREFLNTPAGEPFRDLVDNPAVEQWLGRVGDGFSQIGQEARGVAESVTGVISATQALATSYTSVADQADRVAASAAHTAQVQAIAAQVADMGAARDAARQNELAAQNALVDYHQQQVSLAGDEARIRLSMLPTTERMLELTNATTQAQIRAQQAALPAGRALQDLQNAIEVQRDIASSGARSVAERSAAAAQGAALARGLPEAQLADLRARMAGLPAQRAAQDVGLAGQLQQAQLQQALLPDQYKVDQLTLLSQIASSAKESATRDVKFDNTQITVTLNTAKAAGQLTQEDVAILSKQLGVEVEGRFHAAVLAVDGRGGNSNLLAAGNP